MAKSIAIYSRKSKFTGKGESIENQFELCKQYIEKNFSKDAPFEILVYEDEGFSGKNTARPQLKKLLQDAMKKRFSALVCYRLDRISRNVGDFANLIEELNKLGIDFVSIRESFDTSNPMGRAMMYIASVFAQLERETIAERIRDNMYELSKTGRWLGGTTPTGYKSESVEKVSVDGKIRKAFKLKLIPSEAQLITLIFDKYLETGSLTKTEAYLIQNNYMTKNNLSFTRFSIRSILANPVYMVADEEAYHHIIFHEMDLFSEQKEFDGKHGIMAYNRTLQRDGCAHLYRNQKEWIVSVGKHEGIISGHQWIKVQELLNINKSKSYKKPRSNTALLSGLLFCGKCGNPMRPKLSKRYRENGERSYDYLCTLKEKSNSKCCNIINLQGNTLDSKICTEIKKLPGDDMIFTKLIDKLYNTIEGHQKEKGSERERLQKLLNDNDKEITSIINTLVKASGTVAEQYIIKQIEACHEKSELIKNQIGQLEKSELESQLTEIEFDSLKQGLLDFSFCFDQASIDDKRSVIRSFIHKIIWDGSNVHLYLKNHEAISETLCEDSK